MRWVLVGVLAAVVVGVSVYAFLSYVPRDEHFRIEFSRIEVPTLPRHVPPSFLGEVQSSGSFPDRLDPREEGLLPRLHDAFSRHPWVEHVERVILFAPRGIRVQLTYRTPVAVVIAPVPRERATRRSPDYTVDGLGVLLPAGPREPDLLQIIGAPNVPAGVPGTRWGDPVVEEAARLAGLLHSSRQGLRLVAIEIGANRISPDLRVRTEKGTQILWRTLDDDAREIADAEKLRRLMNYRERHGDLDSPNGPYLLDVRPEAGLLRQSLRK